MATNRRGAAFTLLEVLERFHFRSGATGGLSARVSGRTGSKLPVAPDAFTLLEVLTVVALIALLLGIALPALQRARGRGKLVACAANLRQIGQGLMAYASEQADRLPVNIEPWKAAYAGIRGREMKGDAPDTWVAAIQRALGLTAPPFMRPLRCPLTLDRYPLECLDIPANEGGMGSAWYLNSYCSGRMLSSIPSASDGVLVFEGGLWTSMSQDTGQLELSTTPWAYPHPAVCTDTSPARWNWPYRGYERNILWCDGHADASRAARWPYGDFSIDRDRIRHMRFGCPGTNPLDP